MQNINSLIETAVFDPILEKKQKAGEQIRSMAQEQGIHFASIQNLYTAFAKNEVRGFCVPAINIRNLTYDFAALIFRIAQELKIGAFIFEIARGEVTYTDQTHEQYALSILAAAVAEGWKGPVFLQADHTQFNAAKYKTTPDAAKEDLKKLINQAIAAGFYNIDIDASTLVDLSKTSVLEQQQDNYMNTAALARFIREIEPSGVSVSIGGEIGHIGGKNSTVDDFEAFMKGFEKEMGSRKLEDGRSMQGLSKISVQTGTSHGGIMLPDGTMQDAVIDFQVHTSIGTAAREQFSLGGTVQHGASTVPLSQFPRFVESRVIEVHLATGFQNIMFDHLPSSLQEDIRKWVLQNCEKDRKKEWNDTQFVYSMRKRANGPFKKRLWHMSLEEKKPVMQALEKELRSIFEKLGLHDTKRKVEKYF